METQNNEHHHESHEGSSGEEKVALQLTENAIKKVVAFSTGNKEAEGKHLRIYVQGGGCSGFEYGFTFDDLRDDDQVLEFGNIKVLLDPISQPYLQGSTVDFVEDFRGSGFSVKNPNASGSCGCGHSFSV
ncbi:MAG: iron-sulfur cluster insertion protein ErpA [Deltaproteobacteria bacterium]|nr:MAG: iron-sulfur cluster insertion protein ErpA [Deltaproteobacteria bacterium]